MVQLCPLIFAAIVSAKHTPIQAEGLKEKINQTDLDNFGGLKGLKATTDKRRKAEDEREREELELAQQKFKKLAQEKAKSPKTCVKLNLKIKNEPKQPTYKLLGEFENKDGEGFKNKDGEEFENKDGEYKISYKIPINIMNVGEPAELVECTFESKFDDMTKLISKTEKVEAKCKINNKMHGEELSVMLHDAELSVNECE